MSYIKQGFTSGQTLKADHLNYIEDGIEAISSSAGDKVIILETTQHNSTSSIYYFYNGENLDGDFVLDCLLSGYQFIVKYDGCYYSMREWYTNGTTLYMVTNDYSLSPEFTITTA